jgi:hypothetical protein
VTEEVHVGGKRGKEKKATEEAHGESTDSDDDRKGGGDKGKATKGGGGGKRKKVSAGAVSFRGEHKWVNAGSNRAYHTLTHMT